MKEGALASAARPVDPAAPENRNALLLMAVVAAAGIILSASNQVFDPDLWQHLAVGRALWELKRIPMEHVWTWPNFGMPEVPPSWLYRALLWPFWSVGGIFGFFVWRWILALATFALAWATARKIGARGFSTFVVLVVCSLMYRRRSQRPEALAILLFSLMIWILESRRHGGRDRILWLVPIEWLWVNAHISYFLGFVLIGIHVVGAWWTGARTPRGTRALLPAGLLTLAASFLNPSGWRALWQPFDFFLHVRGEPIFQKIAELEPVWWGQNWTNGFPVLVAAWPLLAWWRARRRGWDPVEILSCAFFTLLTLSAQRFMAFYALIAAPFLARDLAEWLASRRWSLPEPARAALAAAACVLVGLPDWTSPNDPLGVRHETRTFPLAACDFIEREGVRGRAFNQFHWGGYMLYRFWPDRGRLPFMDVHQSGTPRTRLGYMMGLTDPNGWRDLDAQFRFDYVLLTRPLPPGGRLLDILDADSSWALVFLDDPAALYVRRNGPLADVARRFSYRRLPGGSERLETLRQACKTDSVAYAETVAELRRYAQASPRNSEAHSLLANLALLKGEFVEARMELGQALAVNTFTPRAHWRLGLVALADDRPAEAIREFLAQRRIEGEAAGMTVKLGIAYQRVGDRRRARFQYEWALRRDPTDREARDSLAALESGPRR